MDGRERGWSVGTDLAAHRAAVQAFLASDPVEHTSQATVLASLAAGVAWSDVPPLFALHRDDRGEVDAAALTTPPHPLVLDGAVDPAGLVAAVGGRTLAGVNAPVPVAEAFTAAWAASHDVVVEPDHRLHLLELPTTGDLVEPPHRAGTEVRPATPDDLREVLALVTAMRAEIGEHGASPEQIHRDRIVAGLLWLLDDGSGPVATAQASRAVAGVSRVAGVYTEPSVRGRGHAAAVTAAVTRAAFAAGATQVCLFTDAANPTSNGVYERLGYRRRPHDRLVLRFRAG
ncbi:GNAT family N-acetyltransferase [Jatrophihabitans sp. YIM 134969]